MDNKDLITRFAEDCFRFEALHEEIDCLIADADNEVRAYEYEDLSDQAAEIVLKLSANGKNLGERFYRYYVERLEYIIDYFRALLDYEETPLAEDKQDELEEENAAVIRFGGNPVECAFKKTMTFHPTKWNFEFTPTAKDEKNGAADEPDAVEEDDSEDEQPAELENENDAQAAESDEAAAAPAAGVPLPPGEKPCTSSKYSGLDRLSSADRDRVRDTVFMWHDMNVITGRYDGGDKWLPTAEILRRGSGFCIAFSEATMFGSTTEILAGEIEVRRIIWEAIDAIPGFRDSEKFKELIEKYPTYNEKKQ